MNKNGLFIKSSSELLELIHRRNSKKQIFNFIRNENGRTLFTFDDVVRAKVGGYDEKTGCLHWTQTLHKDGYSVFQEAQKFIKEKDGQSSGIQASVMIWELVNQMNVPGGLVVRHLCNYSNSRTCIQPSHLVLGTAFENYRDRKFHNNNYNLAPTPSAGHSALYKILNGYQVKNVQYACIKRSGTNSVRYLHLIAHFDDNVESIDCLIQLLIECDKNTYILCKTGEIYKCDNNSIVMQEIE